MSKEELIAEIKTQRSIIKTANRKIDVLMEQLEAVEDSAWDWITVKQGAEFLHSSVSLIYRKIDLGLLDVKYIGSKKLVRKSELELINDR